MPSEYKRNRYWNYSEFSLTSSSLTSAFGTTFMPKNSLPQILIISTFYIRRLLHIRTHFNVVHRGPLISKFSKIIADLYQLGHCFWLSRVDQRSETNRAPFDVQFCHIEGSLSDLPYSTKLLVHPHTSPKTFTLITSIYT